MYYELVSTMHEKFGFHETVDSFDKDKFLKFLDFRASSQIQEEVNEYLKAIEDYRYAEERDDKEAMIAAIQEINDAIIDILVFTFGTATFTMTQDEVEKSYQTVMEANLKKERGIKPGRPNKWGLPDLLKPEGWVSPDITPFSKTLADRLID
ncbi:putative NTP pyrophosphohydrolase protein [Rhizobium phage RHph_I46]|uniref:Putative NTP pyrophosphohydrolase protein n=1 Tax=Rhizobium phage RHph_I1_9 TaxID=2509729 RepID=A0A7S5R9G7_9CAUD|nr:putative NTP pyrophosphohydrolase protein [Rhizobium phage RHph_I1_9]QIG69705.1 putative NTP pyrophosphohydrolase protein [Rhizobium phage RHph_I46]QIG70986.1 putative NTP pyrophosphohydrolase protein [Rhizobium phage RHph_I9]QIG73572.1 putative NTP pyrophosphohydrolase protein [Rhizobium phage RHph_I1_9]QIG76325.1 putative NTP pyrophosphohydrolase protein [Rhizobium phage RHph_I34]